MNGHIDNHVKKVAQQMLDQLGYMQYAIVDAYDPLTHRVRVRRQPESDSPQNSLSAFMPVVTSGIGVKVCPSPGDVGIIVHEGGSLQSSAFLGVIYYQGAAPPGGESGEIILVHESGSFVKITNDQKVSINGSIEIDMSAPTINITIANDVNVSADNINLTASEKIRLTAPDIEIGADGQTLEGLMNEAAKAIYNAHTHNAPGGVTSAPNQQMGGSVTTTTIKGG